LTHIKIAAEKALRKVDKASLDPVSALGQKQTCAPHNGMSALPPIATAKADMPQW
jgi:hypothetical protein